MNEFAELYHLGLVVALLWLIKCWMVMLWPAIRKILRERKWNSTTLTVLGIAAMYIGHGGDNTYWGLAWLFHYWESDLANVLHDNGYLSNIWVRATTGIVAVTCHLLAEDYRQAEAGSRPEHNATQAIKEAGILATGAIIFIWAVKHWGNS